VVATIGVGRAPRSIAIGAGAVWVACTGSGSVWRIDGATNRAKRFARGLGDPLALTVADRSLWVTTNGDGGLTRFPLRR
jgi:streptogramin lyase